MRAQLEKERDYEEDYMNWIREKLWEIKRNISPEELEEIEREAYFYNRRPNPRNIPDIMDALMLHRYGQPNYTTWRGRLTKDHRPKFIVINDCLGIWIQKIYESKKNHDAFAHQ